MRGRRLRSAGVAAAATAAACRFADTQGARAGKSPDRWSRTNFRGGTVTLLGGPAYAAGALTAVALAPGMSPRARVASLLVGGTSAALGSWDDLAGSPAARGLRGHVTAAARGEITSGQMKLIGIGASGLAAGRLLHRNPVDVVAAGVVVAGLANLINLFDLRPGRALKAGGVVAAGLVTRRGSSGLTAAAALGAAASALPGDLHERTMLGDCGANTFGALLGVSAITGASRRALVVTAAGVLGLTAASEVVSFTAVIARTPWLRALDEWGRAPSPTPVTDAAQAPS